MWNPEWLPAPESTEAEDPGYRIQPSEIVDLLPRLPLVKQQVVDLVIFQGLRQREAGELLGMSQMGVHAHLRHAYELLRWCASRPSTPSDPAEIRAELQHLRADHVEWVIHVMYGAKWSEASRRVGLDPTRSWTLKERLIKRLPEKYRPWLESRPPYPCWLRTRRYKEQVARAALRPPKKRSGRRRGCGTPQPVCSPLPAQI